MTVLPFDRVRDWLFHYAWPIWGTYGLDRTRGGFVEALDPGGRDSGAPFKRIRVQARQIYAFSEAELHGFPGARAAADAGWAFVTRHGRRRDGGWVTRLTRTGEALDPRMTAYDQAFMLFAHGWRFRVTGDPAVIASALRTLDALEDRLALSDGQGFAAVEGEDGLCEQNPHMHMFEAAIVLAEATGHPRFLALARTMAQLFRTRLFDRDTGVLREFHGPGWAPLHGEQGQIVEPGHHFEWVWLLHRAAPILGVRFQEEARALYGHAMRLGVNPATGRIYNQITADGTVLCANTRCWPYTEALKAHLAMMEGMGVDTRPAIARTLHVLSRDFLDHSPRGTWIDCRGPEGQNLSTTIPASTLYHLQVALTELLRLEPLITSYARPRCS